MSSVTRKVITPVLKIVSRSRKGGVLGVAKAGAGVAKLLAPVDKNQLRPSIEAESINEKQAIYGSSVEHAINQEFGTSKMPAQPFLRPSADWLKNQAGNIYAKILKGALRRG